MVWRRVLVPTSISLHELHGVIQVAMGWDSIHLFEFGIRAVRYGSFELHSACTNVILTRFGFRQGDKFRYVYDLGACWDHEIRLEGFHDAVQGKSYPVCIGGSGVCPPEDCGGPDGYIQHRDDATGYEAMMALDTMVEFTRGLLENPDRRINADEEAFWDFEQAVQRSQSRAEFLENKFSRRIVNQAFRQNAHGRLMHQQIM